jgi:hypothetical protein
MGPKKNGTRLQESCQKRLDKKKQTNYNRVVLLWLVVRHLQPDIPLQNRTSVVLKLKEQVAIAENRLNVLPQAADA